jgi:CHAD domain-containing protein
MFGAATPLTIFQQQTEILRAQMPGLFSGSIEAVHDGRIVTRRIRAVLPLMHEWQRRDQAEDMLSFFQGMGRSLGRIRDADVRLELLRYFEARLPPAAPALALIRQEQEHERLRLVRKLVKRFERLDVERQIAHLAGRDAWRRTSPWTTVAGAWRTHLRELIAERAHNAAEAIAHATGVYFPNRAHQSRIAIKKCRYAVEIGAQTGITADPRIVRELKKAQDILGELHDRQTLIDQFRARQFDGAGIDAGQVQLAIRVADVEINDLHGRVLARRPRLLAAIDAAQRTARQADRAAGALAVAGLVVVGSGIEVLRRRQRTRSLEPLPEFAPTVALRIPVALGRRSGE